MAIILRHVAGRLAVVAVGGAGPVPGIGGGPPRPLLVDGAELTALLERLDPTVELVAFVDAGSAGRPEEAVAALEDSGADAAVGVVAVTEAVKRTESGVVVADVDRDRLVTASLPAVFRRRMLDRVSELAAPAGESDLTGLVLRAGGVVIAAAPSGGAGAGPP